MADKPEHAEKKLESEIEVARHELEFDIERAEKDAKAKLDDILSKEKMEFCSRCGKKIGGRADWAGKCLWPACKELLCRHCWDVDKNRFCKRHSERVTGKPEKMAREKEFFEPDEPDVKIDLRAMLDQHDESRLAKLNFLAGEYGRFVQQRFGKLGPIDWTPTRYLGKASFEAGRDGEDSVIKVKTKGWIRKKVKLTVVISPFDTRGDVDVNSVNAMVHKMARSQGGYKIIVLVTDGAKLELVTFVNKFSDTSFCLFMAEPRKGNLYFNIKDPVTAAYSAWFNQKKDPLDFNGELKRLAELVSGRLVVSESEAARHFGFRRKDVRGILKSCPFLSHIKDTDTFFWREQD